LNNNSVLDTGIVQALVENSQQQDAHHNDVPRPHVMPEGDEDPAILDDDVEEVWCTPPIPYTGKSFASKEEAKTYYNSYAKKIGYSTCISATRLKIYDKGAA
jgi:hypothetical protein